MDDISNFKDNIHATKNFILNETPQGFNTEPALNLAAHLETMRDSWEATLNGYYSQMAEDLSIIAEYVALNEGGPAKPCDKPIGLALVKLITDPGLVPETFNKYLLPKDAVLPFPGVDEEGSVADLAEFEACLFCTELFYSVWHSAVVRNGAACPAGLVLHMAEVSLKLSQFACCLIGVSSKDITMKALLGSQKARKSGAKALRVVVFDAICAKKPAWFRRYGVSMVSIAKDLIRETRIDRTPKQVTKYIRDGLSRGDFADTGLEEVLREIYCKIPKKGNLL